MSIKVCHMTSSHPSKDQRIFYKECVSLAKAGYEVYLVEQGESEEDQGVHIVGTQEENKGRFYRLLTRARNVYKIAKSLDADIYHFHDMELLPYGVKLKRKGKKVIFDSHEDFAKNFSDSDALPLPKGMRKQLAKLYSWYQHRCLKKFDAVISVTPRICDRLEKSNTNTVMVTNYPLLDAGKWQEDMQYHPESEYVGFAGKISEYYNVAFIGRSIQAVKDTQLWLCGPVHRMEYLDQIKENDSEGKVKYLGILPYADIPTFFNNARAGIVVPGYSGNLGGTEGTLGCNKLYEAMLCGVPVICTDFTIWKEMVEKYRCGICVNPYDEKQFADAVQYILDHPAEAEEMGQNGRKAVLEEYNWNTQEQVLLELYEKLTA